MALSSSSFLQSVHAHSLFGENSRLIVAVSGGIDSSVLCHLLFVSGFLFEMAHVNHGLRGKESDEDEQFLHLLAEKYQTTLHVHRANLQSEQSGIQEQARQIRYGWLRDLSMSNENTLILTAHHRDDQAETIIHQFVRGGSLKSLTGMRHKSGPIVRPLLDFTRAEVMNHARAHDLQWREDSSNQTLKYTRNYIRHQVIPVLQQINPAVSETIAERAVYLEEADRLVDDVLTDDLARALSKENQTESIDLDWFLAYRYPALLLWKWLEPHGFHSSQMKEVQKLCSSRSGASIENDKARLWKDRSRLILAMNENQEVEVFMQIMSLPWRQERGQDIEISECDPRDFHRDHGGKTLFIDMTNRALPVILRTWKEGDSFRPFGMRGRQKISDLLIQRKIPMHKKKHVLVLQCGEEIAAVPGLAISDDFRISESSERCFRIVMHGEL